MTAAAGVLRSRSRELRWLPRFTDRHLLVLEALRSGPRTSQHLRRVVGHHATHTLRALGRRRFIRSVAVAFDATSSTPRRRVVEGYELTGIGRALMQFLEQLSE